MITIAHSASVIDFWIINQGLSLNVWVPKTAQKGSNLPVVVVSLLAISYHGPC